MVRRASDSRDAGRAVVECYSFSNRNREAEWLRTIMTSALHGEIVPTPPPGSWPRALRSGTAARG